jgi:hypothetical protein
MGVWDKGLMNQTPTGVLYRVLDHGACMEHPSRAHGAFVSGEPKGDRGGLTWG